MPTKVMFSSQRKFDARPDRIDFRDLPYRARLTNLPDRYPSEATIAKWFPVYSGKDLILDQGQEGSCTGFGLAGVVNYLRWELGNQVAIERGADPVKNKVKLVSARMLYQNARLYDEWKGEDYDGSSCRGAMKGFHKHGVCRDQFWPNFERPGVEGLPRDKWDEDATQTPLGAYYRIDSRSIVDMQSAILETHAIYVSADVHDGWDRVKNNCPSIEAATIEPPRKPDDVGGHAFAIVGYVPDGFIIQNSWGPKWGFKGFAILPYEDWTTFGTDAWVLTLGAPMRVMLPPVKKKGKRKASVDANFFCSPPMRTALSLDERLRARAFLRSKLAEDTSQISPWINGEEAKRIVFIGHNGSAERELVAAGSGNDAVATVVRDCVNAATSRNLSSIAIYAHGGLNNRQEGVNRARVLGPWLEANGIIPIFVVWQSGFMESATDILKGALEKLGVPVSADKGWLRNKIDEVKDRAFEAFARDAGVKAIWENMKSRAEGASSAGGGLDTAAAELQKALGQLANNTRPKIHLMGHSAGAIMLGHFLSAMEPKNLTARSIHLWAPACTVQFATDKYGRAFNKGVADPKTTFIDILSDGNETSDACVPGLYSKSLLYLVSRALETIRKAPVLGMQKAWTQWSADADFVDKYQEILDAWDAASRGVVVDAPIIKSQVSTRREGSKDDKIAANHGSFDNNLDVVNEAIKRITGDDPAVPVTDLEGF
jgi:hypothetical protein